MSYLLMRPIGFILSKTFFINSYSSSGQNMVHIQGSVSTHPVICNNPSRVCNTASHPQSVFWGCRPQMCRYRCRMVCYRSMDGSIQTPGCAPYEAKRHGPAHGLRAGPLVTFCGPALTLRLSLFLPWFNCRPVFKLRFKSKNRLFCHRGPPPGN